MYLYKRIIFLSNFPQKKHLLQNPSPNYYYYIILLLAKLPVVAGFKYKKCLQPNFNRMAADQDGRLILIGI